MTPSPKFKIKHELKKKDGKIRFKKLNPNGHEHFFIKIYVEGDLDSLKMVEYELHSTFKNPIRESTNRESGFPLNIWTWGEFDIYVIFHFKDGTTKETVYPLKYSNQLVADPKQYRKET